MGKVPIKDYEPKDVEAEELLMPAFVKPLAKTKNFVNMDKAVGRRETSKVRESNIDLLDIAEDNGEFRGTDMLDIDKAFR